MWESATMECKHGPYYQKAVENTYKHSSNIVTAAYLSGLDEFAWLYCIFNVKKLLQLLNIATLSLNINSIII